METVEQQLMAIVQQEFGLDQDAVTPESLLADLGDSLDQMALLTAVEDAFDVTIDPEQGGSLVTVGDVLSVLPVPGRDA